MVDYGKIVSGAMRFGVEPKRWLPLFVLDALFVAGLLSHLLGNASAIADITAASTQGLAVAQSIINMAVAIFSMFVVWSLVRLFVLGSLIHQSVKPKEYRKSCTVAKERFLPLLAVSIIVGLASWVTGMIPYIGWLVSIVIGLMLFYSTPAVVVSKVSFDNALREAYRLFRDRFPEVLFSWILIVLISVVIVIVFMIPVFMISFNLLIPELIAMGEGTTGTEFLSVMLDAGWSLLPGMIIALVGFAMATVFGVNAQTNFYLQIRKKKGIL